MSPPPGLDGDGAGGRRGQHQNHRSTPSLSGQSQMAGGGGAQSPSSAASASSSLLTIVKAQISFLLSTLNDENFGKNRQDLRDVSRLQTLVHTSRYADASFARCSSRNSTARKPSFTFCGGSSWDARQSLPAAATPMPHVHCQLHRRAQRPPPMQSARHSCRSTTASSRSRPNAWPATL